MPWYDTKCTQCAYEGEQQSSIAECDNMVCPDCGKPVERLIPLSLGDVKVDYRFQMKAVMSDGTHVPGSFGRSDRKNKGRF